MQKLFYIILLATVVSGLSGQNPSSEISWKKIDEGLYLSEYPSPKKSSLSDSKITILKIDPSKYNFNLLSAKENGEIVRTAKQWAEQKKQIAVINAGMYQADYATNVGYMKDYDFINNSSLNNDNTIAAFNRKDKSVPEIQVIDLTCQNWEDVCPARIAHTH